MNKSHNGKNIEVTFAHLKAIREYLKAGEDEKRVTSEKPAITLQVSNVQICVKENDYTM